MTVHPPSRTGPCQSPLLAFCGLDGNIPPGPQRKVAKAEGSREGPGVGVPPTLMSHCQLSEHRGVCGIKSRCGGVACGDAAGSILQTDRTPAPPPFCASLPRCARSPTTTPACGSRATTSCLPHAFASLCDLCKRPVSVALSSVLVEPPWLRPLLMFPFLIL